MELGRLADKIGLEKRLNEKTKTIKTETINTPLNKMDYHQEIPCFFLIVKKKRQVKSFWVLSFGGDLDVVFRAIGSAIEKSGVKLWWVKYLILLSFPVISKVYKNGLFSNLKIQTKSLFFWFFANINKMKGGVFVRAVSLKVSKNF